MTGPGSASVSVGGAAAGFPLVMNESFGAGWEVTGLVPGAALYTTGNGYANAWYVAATPPTDAHLRFGPNRLALVAIGFSLGDAWWR